METKKFNVVIIGGGPAGMIAALSTKHHHPDMSVAIIDRTFELGRKLLVSGAGRGNLTNIHLQKDLRLFYHGDVGFIQSVFSQFTYEDIRNFFETRGIPLYEEIKTGRGKIFSVIDNAKTVRDILVREIEIAGVQIFCNTTVSGLQKNDSGWEIQTNSDTFVAKTIILTCGGKTYPSLGSDGSGYEFAKILGHTIILPVPSAVPLVSKNQFSHFLQGEKMNMKVTSIIGGESQTTAVGDVMFTQYGISGPAVFDVSRDISIRINREGKIDTTIVLRFFPDMTDDEVRMEINRRIENYKERPVAECIWGLLTSKSAGAICAILKFSKEKKAGELSMEERETLINLFLHIELVIDQTRGWNEAEFTAGGVDTGEVNSITLESLKANGIYIAGEVLDVDGQVGGYNLSWAWSSGWVAGKLQ